MSFPALIIDHFRKSDIQNLRPNVPWFVSPVSDPPSASDTRIPFLILCVGAGEVYGVSPALQTEVFLYENQDQRKAWNHNSEQSCTRVTPTNTVQVTVHVSTALINRSANSMNDLRLMSKFLSMIYTEQTRHCKAFYFLHSKDLKKQWHPVASTSWPDQKKKASIEAHIDFKSLQTRSFLMLYYSWAISQKEVAIGI